MQFRHLLNRLVFRHSRCFAEIFIYVFSSPTWNLFEFVITEYNSRFGELEIIYSNLISSTGVGPTVVVEGFFIMHIQTPNRISVTLA